MTWLHLACFVAGLATIPIAASVYGAVCAFRRPVNVIRDVVLPLPDDPRWTHAEVECAHRFDSGESWTLGSVHAQAIDRWEPMHGNQLETALFVDGIHVKGYGAKRFVLALKKQQQAINHEHIRAKALEALESA